MPSIALPYFTLPSLACVEGQLSQYHKLLTQLAIEKELTLKLTNHKVNQNNLFFEKE